MHRAGKRGICRRARLVDLAVLLVALAITVALFPGGERVAAQDFRRNRPRPPRKTDPGRTGQPRRRPSSLPALPMSTPSPRA